jgi:geranylgeranyl reductase family protein
MQWDVIVIGTGPAGSIAAYELARNGCRTLLLEKEKLPRYKTCGGGLVQRSLSALPFSISSVAERMIETIQLSKNFTHPVQITRQEPPIVMTMRSSLDQFLVQKAVEAGAELRECTKIDSVHETNTGIECVSCNTTFSADFLIGADGANSVVAKSLKWPAARCGVALEVEVSLFHGLSQYNNRADFDFAVLPFGYGWVFPKSKHLSCGVFTLNRSAPVIRKDYETYIQKKEFAKNISDSKLSGHLIPLRPVSDTLNTARTILAGDAAGLADPLTGEGISFAIRSGMIAAKSILQSKINRYSEEINDDLAPDIRFAGILARVLYAAPSTVYRVARRKEFFADAILDLFAGKTTYRNLAKQLLFHPYKLL